mgnify:CR=1 FL=1
MFGTELGYGPAVGRDDDAGYIGWLAGRGAGFEINAGGQVGHKVPAFGIKLQIHGIQ